MPRRRQPHPSVSRPAGVPPAALVVTTARRARAAPHSNHRCNVPCE
jgi:hypothetical protein